MATVTSQQQTTRDLSWTLQTEESKSFLEGLLLKAIVNSDSGTYLAWNWLILGHCADVGVMGQHKLDLSHYSSTRQNSAPGAWVAGPFPLANGHTLLLMASRIRLILTRPTHLINWWLHPMIPTWVGVAIPRKGSNPYGCLSASWWK